MIKLHVGSKSRSGIEIYFEGNVSLSENADGLPLVIIGDTNDGGDDDDSENQDHRECGSTEIPLQASPGGYLGIERVPLALAEIQEAGRKWRDLTGYTRIRCIVRVDSPASSGTKFLAQWTVVPEPTEADWSYFDTVAGPYRRIDTAGTFYGAWVPITPAAQRNVMVRFCTVNGDDETDVVLGNCSVECTCSGEDTNPCSETEIEVFDFATVAELDAVWPEDPAGLAGVTWSVGGGEVGLTLENNVAVQRSNQLCGYEPGATVTFGMDVTASDADMRAFLALGDQDTQIAGAGSERLLVTGLADNSGCVTIAFGALGPETTNGTLIGSENWTYTTQGEALSAWPVIAVSALCGNFSASDGLFVADIMACGIIGSPGGAVHQRVFSGLIPGNRYRVTAYMTQTPAQNLQPTNLTASGGAGGSSGTVASGWSNEDTTPTSYIVTVGSAGTLTLRINLSVPYQQNRQVYHTVVGPITIESLDAPAALTATFGALIQSCLNDLVPEIPFEPDPELPGGGTGGGDPTPEPPGGGDWPDPPVTSDRPFGIHNIPLEGMAVWNSTIAGLRQPNAVSYLAKSKQAGSKNMFRFGGDRDWMRNGKFSYAAWKAVIDAVYNDPETRAAVNNATADRSFFCHYVIDEPFHPTRYGGPIDFSVVEDMCEYSKTLFPNLPTVIRVAPVDSRFSRHMSGLDWLWSEYNISKGDPEAWRDNNIERAQKLGHGLVMGLHYYKFDPHKSVYVTPSQFRQYGTILASSKFLQAFGGWKYGSGLLTQPGFSEALIEVRDVFASFSP